MFGVAVLTILHELVHVAQWDQVTEKTQHGREFNARMKQLAAKGAFVGLW
jgi:predicted SprT family Zn-dependent metalloprotease